MTTLSGVPWAAWGAHFYTATGAVVAFLATLAVGIGDFRRAFAWLLVAVLVDASDGWLARRARVTDWTPQIDGTKLDDVIDYLTFVFVPMLIVWRADLLPGAWGLAVVAVVLTASGLAFVRTDAKTADHFFTGFPSYWNVVALYLVVWALPVVANAVILLLLAGMLFVRVGYLYPSRTPIWRTATVALGIVWGVMLAGIIWRLPAPPGWLVAASLFYPAYYFGMSFMLHGRRTGAAVMGVAMFLAAGTVQAGSQPVAEGSRPAGAALKGRATQVVTPVLSAPGVVRQTPAPPQARIAQTFTLPPGKPIVIEATVGDVTIAAWPRPEVDVQIERSAERGADVARIDPRLEERSDGLFISARQADGPPDRALRAAITIRAPATTVFKSVQLVDGRISLEGLRGSISADVRSGAIEGSRLAGTVRLETGLGSVEVRQAELTPGGLLRLRAFNGNATLHLAAVPADARILALSFNGTITSDIPLTMKEAFGPRFGETTLGKGEPVISMDAVYGDVVIRVERRD